MGSWQTPFPLRASVSPLYIAKGWSKLVSQRCCVEHGGLGGRGFPGARGRVLPTMFQTEQFCLELPYTVSLSKMVFGEEGGQQGFPAGKNIWKLMG